MFESSHKSQNDVIWWWSHLPNVSNYDFCHKTSSSGSQFRSRRIIKYSTLFISFQRFSKILPSTNFRMIVKWKVLLHGGWWHKARNVISTE